MSQILQNNEEDKRYRSIKMCQLIYDRRIDSEIGYEIRKFLEQGVIIDFQDQNRNKKTALHLAVEKSDVICIKFLLQFKPSLKVKDEDGKTPIELAESNGNQNIINVLLNSTVDVMNESYIVEFDYESISRQRIEAIKSSPTFKVLKLTNCPSINKAWNKVSDHDYTATLNESSHLFFITIETNERNIDNDYALMKKVLKVQRPMIVQLSSSKCQNTKIYFKDRNNFMEITETPKITLKEFNEAVESNNECNLQLLLAALQSNLFGFFTGNLLHTKLYTNEDRNEAVNQFAKSNALCHRFFQLFDENPPQIDRIVATLSFKGDQSLLALLDLPFETSGKLKLNECQQDILNVIDSSGCNLLMMATEQINFDALKLLIHYGCDFNHSDNYNKRAVDICWEMKAFGYLAALIEAGSPYPSNFHLDALDEYSEEHERINAIIEAINSFHDHIKRGETEDVKKFISSHPHIKHAFDSNNKCALTVALQSNRVDIYSLLMSEGFEPGADDEYQSACSKSSHKNEIRNSHRKYFKQGFNEPHLRRLLKKFRLSFGSKNRAKCSTIIRKMFDKLNEIDEVIPVLKTCSFCDKLRIVFDFNCESVEDMDVTKDSSSLGAVYPTDGFIYIGAKNHEEKFCEVIGNLIHELTHYAMKLTYENSCKPYIADDIASTRLFENISMETKRICETNPSTDSIVTTVFKCYSSEFWHQELIVRVSHLLAHHKLNPKALKAAERNTPELFHFYREKTLHDVETKSKALRHKYLIRNVNNQTGIARKIESLNVKFENVETNLQPSVYVISGNAPQFTLAMLIQRYPADSHIFVTLEQAAIGNILEKIAKVNVKESETETALIIDCIGQLQKYTESLKMLLRNVKNIKTIAMVMTEAESSTMKQTFSKVEFKTFDHEWVELTESSKVHLLNQNVIFQGIEMKLDDIVEPSSAAMNFVPLSELVDCKDFKIGKELHQTSHKFYIDRKFIRKSQGRSRRTTENAEKFEGIFKKEPRMGAMIISDEAGSGKSVTLFEIAKSLHVAYPDRWVLFVDLKRYIEAFKSVANYKKIETFEDFIGQNILQSETKFDVELFKQMFRDGKTFVLLDGFDEICPNYKDLLLHVLKLFDLVSGNKLFITTRLHLDADLENALGKFVFTLEEFSEESQASFLREYWHSVGFEISREDFNVLSFQLFNKFYQIAAQRLIGLPLLLRMTAEIFEDPLKENSLQKVNSLSITSVFQKFMEKHLARWTNSENEISRSETVEFVMAGGVLEVHHNIAINDFVRNHNFDEDFECFDIAETDAEKILRVGLIRYDKTEKTFQFVHETFSEYFVANFIWFHLSRKNMKPTHDSRLAVEILMKVLLRNDFSTEVIRTFLDQTLEAMKFTPSEAFCESIAKCLIDFLKSRNRFDFLVKCLVVAQENLESLLLSVVKHFEKDLLLKMLQSKTSVEGSALLHVVAFKRIAIVSTLCDIISTCTDNPKEIYQVECPMGNVLLRAARNRHEGVLTNLCAKLILVLTKDEIKILFQQKEGWYGHNIIAIAAINSSDAIFLELISLLPSYLSQDEIKSLLMAVDNENRNFFHRSIICDTNESLRLKLDVVETNFIVEERKTYFYKPATALNMFQFAALSRNEKAFETIVGTTRDVFVNDEIKSMLMQKDSQGSNLLHYTAEHGDKYVLNELSLLLRERFTLDEVRSMLVEVNNKGKNCFRLAANNININLQVFCETIGDLISIEDQTRLLQQSIYEIDIIRLACGNYNTREFIPIETLKHLLTRQYSLKRNAFQEAAYRGNVDEWNKLISFAQARFSEDELKTFLFRCDNAGEDCLRHAIYCFSNENMIEAIFKTIKTVVSSVEEQKNLVKQKDSANRNVFHLAATSFDIFKCLSLYDSLSAMLSKDELMRMMREKNSDGDNVLCYNRKLPFHDLESIDLMPFLQAVLTNAEIKDLLSDVDREGRNFFHCTVEFSSKVAIKSLSKAIKKILNRDDQKKLCGIKYPNVFHLAVRNLKSGIFSTLHECLKDVLTENEIKSLIHEKDSKNGNILHLICHHDAIYNTDNRLSDFLKVLKVICDADELKSFVTSVDSNGSNCLLLAAQFRDSLFLNGLIFFIQNELFIDDQRNLIQTCDNDGKNIFMSASLNKVPEMLLLVEHFAREILTESQIEVLRKHRREIVEKMNLAISRCRLDIMSGNASL